MLITQELKVQIQNCKQIWNQKTLCSISKKNREAAYPNQGFLWFLDKVHKNAIFDISIDLASLISQELRVQHEKCKQI